MFKVFGVSHDGNETEKMEIKTFETTTSTPIEVNMREERDYDTDIGQIAVDILDTGEHIVIIAPIAGVDPSEVEIGLSRNILTISGTREESPLYKEARRTLVEECFYGAFSRSIILPENLGFDRITASVDWNVITISIPKLTLSTKSIKIEKAA